jgi:dTDP-4-dehydrorhamnose reductase
LLEVLRFPERKGMKRVLIVGANGLLGQRVARLFVDEYDLYCASVEPESYLDLHVPYLQLDITDRQAVFEKIRSVRPDVVINASAYTQVDRAEEEPDLCFAVNAEGVGYLAQACKAGGALLVHVSTDYVFDGKKGNYREEDNPNPLGVYARSKWLGEQRVKEVGGEFLIARTAVLYGMGVRIGPNFPLWVVHSLRNGQTIRVVDDQIGNPTFADDLAAALKTLVERGARGLYHVAGPEPISRYDFAMEIAHTFGLNDTKIQRIKTEELQQKAPRPLDASLDVSKLWRDYGLRLRGVKEQLRAFRTLYEQFQAG